MFVNDALREQVDSSLMSLFASIQRRDRTITRLKRVIGTGSLGLILRLAQSLTVRTMFCDTRTIRFYSPWNVIYAFRSDSRGKREATMARVAYADHAHSFQFRHSSVFSFLVHGYATDAIPMQK